MIAVVDLGMSNVASVRNMLARLGVSANIFGNPEGIADDQPLILPGVGTYDEGMDQLERRGWLDVLKGADPERHILGICLGMQLLGRSSEEGQRLGVGRLRTSFHRFDADAVKVPHMGWNGLDVSRRDPIMDALPVEQRYYFTHSYYGRRDLNHVGVLATAHHGLEFVAVERIGNTVGVQFHPEKSHRFGFAFLKSWSDLACC